MDFTLHFLGAFCQILLIETFQILKGFFHYCHEAAVCYFPVPACLNAMYKVERNLMDWRCQHPKWHLRAFHLPFFQPLSHLSSLETSLFDLKALEKLSQIFPGSQKFGGRGTQWASPGKCVQNMPQPWQWFEGLMRGSRASPRKTRTCESRLLSFPQLSDFFKKNF